LQQCISGHVAQRCTCKATTGIGTTAAFHHDAQQYAVAQAAQ